MKELSNNPAFLYGESVFTTCLVKNGEIQLWEEHLEQLLNNAMKYYFLDQSDKPKLKSLVTSSIKESKFSDGAIRITVSSKSRNKLFSDVKVMDLDVSLNSRIISKQDKPLKLKTFFKAQDSLLDDLKIGSYGKEFYLKKLAMKEGFDDVLFCDDKNIYESSTSNIFFLKDRKLITPISGIYKGIIRNKLILENEVEVREVKLSELDSFDGAFLTNSIYGRVDICLIDNVKFKV